MNSSTEEFANSIVEKEEKYCSRIDNYIGYTEFSYNQEKVLHGFFREIVNGKVTILGIYVNGQKCGPFWKRLDGDAFLVGDGTYLTYLYPDFTSIMYGKSDSDGRMVNGQYGRLSQLKVHSYGLLIPKVIFALIYKMYRPGQPNWEF